MNKERTEILALFFKSKYNKQGKAMSYSTLMIDIYGEMMRAQWDNIVLVDPKTLEYICPDFDVIIKSYFDVVETSQNKWVYVGYNEVYDCLKTVERRYYTQLALEQLDEQ